MIHQIGRLFILVLLVLVLLLPASGASAEAPVSYPGLYEYDGVSEYQPCPGFELWYHEYAPYQETLFFDSRGNLRTLRDHFQGTDTWYNPANPGVQLVGDFNAILEYDVATDTVSGRGIPVHVNVPGYGKVFMWTGNWTIYPTIHRGGIDSLQNPKDMAAFCALLAAN